MTIPTSSAQDLAELSWSSADIVDDVVYGDPFTYHRGTTAERLRSGTDGPHTDLADRLCGLNRSEY